MRKNASKTAKSVIMLCICLIALTAIPCAFSACNQSSRNIYLKDNDFKVLAVEDDEARTFIPVGIEPGFGVIFYVGLFVKPEKYDYLATALARQGYIVVIPKFKIDSAYSGYKETEAAFSNYPNVKFFIAGQDNGGGAAVRRAEENPSLAQGVILFNPICFFKQAYDENGKLLLDEDGNVVKHYDSIASLALPELLIESSVDELRTPEMRKDALSRLNEETLSSYMLENASNVGFFEGDEDSDERAAQRSETVRITLAFLKQTVASK